MTNLEIKIDSDDPKVIFEVASLIKKEVDKLNIEFTFENINFDIDIDTEKLKKNIKLLNQGKLELENLDL